MLSSRSGRSAHALHACDARPSAQCKRASDAIRAVCAASLYVHLRGPCCCGTCNGEALPKRQRCRDAAGQQGRQGTWWRHLGWRLSRWPVAPHSMHNACALCAYGRAPECSTAEDRTPHHGPRWALTLSAHVHCVCPASHRTRAPAHSTPFPRLRHHSPDVRAACRRLTARRCRRSTLTATRPLRTQTSRSSLTASPSPRSRQTGTQPTATISAR